MTVIPRGVAAASVPGSSTGAPAVTRIRTSCRPLRDLQPQAGEGGPACAGEHGTAGPHRRVDGAATELGVDRTAAPTACREDGQG